MALEKAKESMQEEYLEESKLLLKEKPIFHKLYASTLLNKTEFEILKEEEKGEEIIFQVKVKAVPLIIRQSLREIFAKQNESRETNFNGATALSLVYKEFNLTSNNFFEKELMVKLNK